MNKYSHVIFVLCSLFAASAHAAISSNKACDAWLRTLPGKETAAPSPMPGTRWVYSAGVGLPANTLTLDRVKDGMADYTFSIGNLHQQGRPDTDTVPNPLYKDGLDRIRDRLSSADYSTNDATFHLQERLDTYTSPNPLRKGEKVLIRFPLKVGASWEDRFSEPGEMTGSFGTYRYHYDEHAYSTVVALETVKLSFGEVQAYRIERNAFWEKSSPESDNMPDMLTDKDGKVDGSIRSISWYAPALSRVVLRMIQVRIHPMFSASVSDVAGFESSAHTRIIELVGYRNPSGCEWQGEPTRARRENDDLPTVGYPMRPNNTWEFLMQRHEHRQQLPPAR